MKWLVEITSIEKSKRSRTAKVYCRVFFDADSEAEAKRIGKEKVLKQSLRLYFPDDNFRSWKYKEHDVQQENRAILRLRHKTVKGYQIVLSRLERTKSGKAWQTINDIHVKGTQ